MHHQALGQSRTVAVLPWPDPQSRSADTSGPLRDLLGHPQYPRINLDPALARQLDMAASAPAEDRGQIVAELDAAALRCRDGGAPASAAVSALAAALLSREAGLLARARERFAQAAEWARQAGEPFAFALAAFGLGGIWVHEHRSHLERLRVRELQRHALARLEPGDPLALRIRIRLAAEEAYLSRNPCERLRILREAREHADPVALAEALSLAHHCLLGPEHGDIRALLADELMGVSAFTGRQIDALIGLAWKTVDLFLLGDSHAERSFAELQQRLEPDQVHCVRFVLAAIETMLAMREGRLADAERAALRCRQLGSDVGDADAEGWYFAQLSTIRWMQGRGSEMLAELSLLADSATLAEPNESFLAGVAALAASAGMHDRALGALQRVRGGRGLAALRSSSTWLTTMFAVIEAAGLLGDAAVAREAYELLLPFAELPVMASLAVTCFGSAHRPLGEAALTAGDVEGAVRHFEAAVDADLRLGNQPCHAISRSALARALAIRGSKGDHERATRLIAGAVEDGQRFGMSGRVAQWALQRDELRRQAGRISQPLSLRRDGRDWLVCAGGRSSQVPHSVGMTYLAQLVANPGVELAAAELASSQAFTSETSRHDVLDERARREYRDRIEALRAEISEAEAAADAENASRARSELDWLLAELSRVTGLAGRMRTFGDEAERARTSVQKAIRRALTRITASDPAVGAALQRRVVTGNRCVFLAP